MASMSSVRTEPSSSSILESSEAEQEGFRLSGTCNHQCADSGAGRIKSLGKFGNIIITHAYRIETESKNYRRRVRFF